MSNSKRPFNEQAFKTLNLKRTRIQKSKFGKNESDVLSISSDFDGLRIKVLMK